VKFAVPWKKSFSSVKLKLCMRETVISKLLSKDVICALTELGSAILENRQEIYFRKLQHVEFKKITVSFPMEEN